MMPVTAPADKRFRRAYLKPGRRRTGLVARRWRSAFAAALVGLGVSAGYRMSGAIAELDVFQVQRITVRGNQRLSNGEVLALVEGLRGGSILSVDLELWRGVLLNSPWVADASLHRTLPSTVDVAIVERAPLGVGRVNGALYLVDDRGMVIDEFGPAYADLDLPIIDGLSGRSGTAGAKGAPASDEENADMNRAMLARRLLDALRVGNMAGRVSQIDVSDARNAVVLLEGDPTLLRLGHERFVERLQSYFELAPALRESVPAIDYVDLRFDERVYVRPAPPDTRMRRSGNGQDAESGRGDEGKANTEPPEKRL
jgi:cell division septal protein FtsQ